MSNSLSEAEATWRGEHPGTARLVSGDVVAAVRALKDWPGDELQIRGSGKLLQTLLQHDLVDRFRLMTLPAGARVRSPLVQRRHPRGKCGLLYVTGDRSRHRHRHLRPRACGVTHGQDVTGFRPHLIPVEELRPAVLGLDRVDVAEATEEQIQCCIVLWVTGADGTLRGPPSWVGGPRCAQPARTPRTTIL